MSDHGFSYRFFWGFVLIGAGLLFLLDNLGVLNFGEFVSNFWPLILILIGVKMMFFRKSRGSAVAGDVDSIDESSQIDFKHTFGDVRLKLNSKEFSGGEVSNVFGNIEVDMEEMGLAEGDHSLNLKGVFGDLIIILPREIPYSISASTSFGSTRIKDRGSSGMSGSLQFASEDFNAAESKLNINASQVFGDIRVF
jgi:predicted membrane protein